MWVHNRTKYALYSTQKATGEYSKKFLNKLEHSLLNTLLRQTIQVLRLGNLFIRTSIQSTRVLLIQRNTCTWITLNSSRLWTPPQKKNPDCFCNWKGHCFKSNNVKWLDFEQVLFRKQSLLWMHGCSISVLFRRHCSDQNCPVSDSYNISGSAFKKAAILGNECKDRCSICG